MSEYLPPAYQRLLRDGLLGRAVHRSHDRATEQKFERGFQHWQNETVWPESVNRHLKEIGDATN